MKETITFVGNGNMALSIAQGLKEQYDIEVVGRSPESMDRFEQKLGTKIKKVILDEIDINGKIVMLCVKPANIQEVGLKLQGEAKEFYSVLAGTSLEKIKGCVDSKSYVRAMPNLAASVGESLTTLTGDEKLKEKACSLFGAIGESVWLSSEKELDIATAVAGSGPAYLALVHEALCDGAVKKGMKREDAVKVTNGLFKGFGKLIPTIHPALLKDGVMSPGGTTAAGYAALEENGTRSSFIKAVEAAYNVTQGK